MTHDPAPRRQWNVRLSPALIERIEARRHAVGLSRDKWAEAALTHLLDTTQPTTEKADNGTQSR